MRILLSGSGKKYDELRDLYKRALWEAREIYIASAYLTDWDPAWKLGSACQKIVFILDVATHAVASLGKDHSRPRSLSLKVKCHSLADSPICSFRSALPHCVYGPLSHNALTMH
jgi:hypothetical protein